MKFNFKINDFPKETGSYYVPAYTEGTLIVIDHGQVFLNADGILLVEFAVVLKKWLLAVETGNIKDFFFESMDFEESPILEFKFIDSKKVKPFSVWQAYEGQVNDLESVIKAAKLYLAELIKEVETKYHFDLQKRIDQEIAAN